LASEKMQKLDSALGPDDWCSDHHTHEEDQQKDGAIDSFWQRLAVSEKQSSVILQST